MGQQIFLIRDKETGEFSATRDEELARKWAAKADQEIPVLKICAEGIITSATLLGETEDDDYDMRIPTTWS